MATGTRSRTLDVEPYRINEDQFERMIGANVFPEGVHVELIDGILIQKMTKNPPHSITVGLLRDAVYEILPAGWYVDQESSIRIGRSDRPEPDLIVVRGGRRDYKAHPPGPEALALVVEVSDTSYANDRGVKWGLYAAARVPTYWIVKLATRQVEVYSDPSGRGRTASYRAAKVYNEDDAVSLLIDLREIGRVVVREILP